MSKRNPYIVVQDDDDDVPTPTTKEVDHRQERRSVFEAKRWIGSGEDCYADSIGNDAIN